LTLLLGVRVEIEVERAGASPFAPSPADIFKGSDADFDIPTSAAGTQSRDEAGSFIEQTAAAEGHAKDLPLS
jgi:hypothetical protein